MKAGVSLQPDTPLSTIAEVLCDADMFLMMSVEPGFSGQRFRETTLEKVRALKAMLRGAGSEALIEVDGGVNASNRQALCDAGVDVFVCGDYVFKAVDPESVISQLVALLPCDAC